MTTEDAKYEIDTDDLISLIDELEDELDMVPVNIEISIIDSLPLEDRRKR